MIISTSAAVAASGFFHSVISLLNTAPSFFCQWSDLVLWALLHVCVFLNERAVICCHIKKKGKSNIVVTHPSFCRETAYVRFSILYVSSMKDYSEKSWCGEKQMGHFIFVIPEVDMQYIHHRNKPYNFWRSVHFIFYMYTLN